MNDVFFTNDFHVLPSEVADKVNSTEDFEKLYVAKEGTFEGFTFKREDGLLEVETVNYISTPDLIKSMCGDFVDEETVNKIAIAYADKIETVGVRLRIKDFWTRFTASEVDKHIAIIRELTYLERIKAARFCDWFINKTETQAK